MVIAERLRQLREAKDMSQGDIEEKTGLLRNYISRVENGHTIPSLETLEKISLALGMRLYEFLYDGEDPPPRPSEGRPSGRYWGATGKDAQYLAQLRRALGKMKPEQRQLLLLMIQKMMHR